MDGVKQQKQMRWKSETKDQVIITTGDKKTKKKAWN